MAKVRESKIAMNVIVHRATVKVLRLSKILFTGLMLLLNGLKILKLARI
jgi:hypothetical protein